MPSASGDALFPPRGARVAGAAPREAWLAAALALAAAGLFWWPLLAGGSLSGRDWSSHHFHYFDFVRSSLLRFHALPLYMADAVITPNFLANAESPIFPPLLPLLLLLPTGAFLELAIVLYTAAGLAGGYLCLRDLAVPRPLAALFAAAFALSGFFAAHVAAGHPWALGAELLPALVCLFRRAALGSRAARWGGAALAASLLLAGQHQPFVWSQLFLAGFAALWAARARAAFPLAQLGLLLAATAGLAAPKLLPLLAEFRDYAPSARTPGLPPALLATSLLARAQGPALAPDGLVYAHGAGWWEYALYQGPLALAALAAGIAFARQGRLLLVLAAGFLLISLDLPRALDAWRLLVDLPVLRSQRSPSRFLVLVLAACVPVAALGLARAFSLLPERARRGALFAGWAAALLVAADLQAASLPWQRASLGPPILERDHRPQPLAVSAPGGARAQLVAFTPNRFGYAVSAPRAAELVLPLRFGKVWAEWDTGGLPAHARDGRLSIRVPPGESRIEMAYRPPLLGAGLALGAATLLAWLRPLLLPKPRAG